MSTHKNKPRKNKSKPRKNKRSLLFGALALVIVGLVGGTFANFLALPKNVSSFLDNAPKLIHRTIDWWNTNTKISGMWTTDDDGDLEQNKCTAEQPSNTLGPTPTSDPRLPVAMEIKAYAGVVSGEIVSEGIKANNVFSRIQVLGDAAGSKANVFVYDYIGGNKVGFAELQLSHVTVGGEECLRVKVIKQAAAFFPEVFTLHRASKEISGGEYNEGVRERLLKTVKEWSKGKRGKDGKHRICEPNCRP